MSGWIAVDLDGTLAHYDGWVGIENIGEPIQPMLERVKKWLDEGKEVCIFTARVAETDPSELASCIAYIEAWCIKHIGLRLPITNIKDFGMYELWDDRCVQVIPNKGTTLISAIESIPALLEKAKRETYLEAARLAESHCGLGHPRKSSITCCCPYCTIAKELRKLAEPGVNS